MVMNDETDEWRVDSEGDTREAKSLKQTICEPETEAEIDRI